MGTFTIKTHRENNDHPADECVGRDWSGLQIAHIDCRPPCAIEPTQIQLARKAGTTSSPLNQMNSKVSRLSREPVTTNHIRGR